MDTKKNKYKGVISPPMKDEFLRGYGLGRALPRGLMGPPKSLMQPKKQLMVKHERISVEPSKPRYGAGGTGNPKVQKKKPATKKPVAKKKPKTQAQKLYEKQIKARKRRQKKDPLGRD